MKWIFCTLKYPNYLFSVIVHRYMEDIENITNFLKIYEYIFKKGNYSKIENILWSDTERNIDFLCNNASQFS